MAHAIFDGVFYRRGIAGDPALFIDYGDHSRFYEWFSTNSIFTQIIYHPHPISGASCPTVYVSQSAAQPFHDGDPVRVTIDVRPEKRGNGVSVIGVV